MNSRVLIAFLLCWIISCSPVETDQIQFSSKDGEPAMISWALETQKENLQSADPQRDATLAFKRGDLTFLALSGMVVELPGFAHRADLREALEWKRVLGTGRGDAEFDRLAGDYALNYNLKLLELMQQR